jgi:hypothetical protein
MARVQSSVLPANLVCAAVCGLLLVQAALVLAAVHRESLTFDEDDHMFAGYMMWKTGDYGLNPEHPPLVKLLAAVPLLGEDLWVPPQHGWDFKKEAYLDGRDWLAHNDGASQRLVFRMRMAAGLLAWGLSLTVFFATREWFGEVAALVAMTLVVFDPNIMAHSALVTTDVGVTLFFLLSIWTFYRFVRKPTLVRLLLAGLAAGLLAATKHSGILLAPMLLPVMIWEVVAARWVGRARQAARLISGFAAIVLIAAGVLWCFYGFRYAARPEGLALSTSLAEYAAPLSKWNAVVVMGVARFHLLPESYLMGLVDVKRMAEFYPTFALGKVYAHGQWWYFPAVILIKTTLGLLVLNALALFAAVTGKMGRAREVFYVLSPGAVYLAIAMASGIDIGARHILVLYALAAIFAGAGVVALGVRSRTWAWVMGVLVAVHLASSLTNYPQQMAYANEAWGGAKNAHNLLSDANVDWAQQLYEVKVAGSSCGRGVLVRVFRAAGGGSGSVRDQMPRAADGGYGMAGRRRDCAAGDPWDGGDQRRRFERVRVAEWGGQSLPGISGDATVGDDRGQRVCVSRRFSDGAGGGVEPGAGGGGAVAAASGGEGFGAGEGGGGPGSGECGGEGGAAECGEAGSRE